MASVDVTFEMGDIRRVLRGFGTRAAGVPLRPLADVLLEAVDDVIQTEGAAGTQGRWEPFSPRTLQRHPRRRGGMLLQATGELANFQPRFSPGTVVVASPANYSGYHVDGTDNMPRRDPTAINFVPVLDIMGDGVLEEIRK